MAQGSEEIGSIRKLNFHTFSGKRMTGLMRLLWRLLRDHTDWADATVDARVSQALAVLSAVRPENFRSVHIAV